MQATMTRLLGKILTVALFAMSPAVFAAAPIEADLLAAYAPSYASSYASSVGGEDIAQVTIANTVTGSNKIQDQSGTGAHMRIAGFYQSAQEVSGQTTLGGEITWLWNQQWRVQCDAGIYSGTGSRCGSANNRCHRG